MYFYANVNEAKFITESKIVIESQFPNIIQGLHHSPQLSTAMLRQMRRELKIRIALVILKTYVLYIGLY